MSDFGSEINVDLTTPQGTGTNTDGCEKERRRHARRRVLKSGTIAFNDRHSTVTCSVRNLSENGARLTADGSVYAPDTFELLVDLDGLEARCEVAWRSGKDVGIQFTAPTCWTGPKRKQTLELSNKKPSLRRKQMQLRFGIHDVSKFFTSNLSFDRISEIKNRLDERRIKLAINMRLELRRIGSVILEATNC